MSSAYLKDKEYTRRAFASLQSCKIIIVVIVRGENKVKSYFVDFAENRHPDVTNRLKSEVVCVHGSNRNALYYLITLRK